jgi:prefoldin subunit 5
MQLDTLNKQINALKQNNQTLEQLQQKLDTVKTVIENLVPSKNTAIPCAPKCFTRS